jgi:hypothetical protein
MDGRLIGERWIDGWMDGRMDEWMDGCMVGRIDGWLDNE